MWHLSDESIGYQKVRDESYAESRDLSRSVERVFSRLSRCIMFSLTGASIASSATITARRSLTSISRMSPDADQPSSQPLLIARP